MNELELYRVGSDVRAAVNLALDSQDYSSEGVFFFIHSPTSERETRFGETAFCAVCDKLFLAAITGNKVVGGYLKLSEEWLPIFGSQSLIPLEGMTGRGYL